MSAGEAGFWKEVLEQCAPGHTVRVQGTLDAATLPSRMGVRAYFCDTHSGWKAACMLTEDDLLQAGARMRSIPDCQSSVLAAFNERLQEPGYERRSNPEALIQDVMTLVVHYLTTTRTFDLANQFYSSLNGHWLVLMYRLADGGMPLMRPAYMSHSDLLFDAKTLDAWVREVVEHDTQAEGTAIRQEIARGGGAMLMVGLR